MEAKRREPLAQRGAIREGCTEEVFDLVLEAEEEFSSKRREGMVFQEGQQMETKPLPRGGDRARFRWGIFEKNYSWPSSGLNTDASVRASTHTNSSVPSQELESSSHVSDGDPVLSEYVLRREDIPSFP